MLTAIYEIKLQNYSLFQQVNLFAGGEVLGKNVYPVKVTVMQGDLPVSTHWPVRWVLIMLLVKKKTYFLSEWLNMMFTSNGKRDFVPRDQISYLLVVYCLLFLPIN